MGIYNPFQDDQINPINIPALPFYRYRKTVVKPYKQVYPINPQRLGEHIKKVRMDKGLFQKNIAELFEVSEDTINYWENGRSVPQVHHYPTIISFLGYYPFLHETDSIAGKLKQVRYCSGLNTAKCAKLLKIDIATVKRYESGLPIRNPATISMIYSLWFELQSATTLNTAQD